MTKKRTTRKVAVQSPTEIIARNREIDNNIEIPIPKMGLIEPNLTGDADGNDAEAVARNDLNHPRSTKQTKIEPEQ